MCRSLVADNVNTSNACPNVGGNYNQNQNNGMFYSNSNTASNTNGNLGARFLVNQDNNPHRIRP